MSELTMEQESQFNAALLAILVERLGGVVTIDADEFHAFMERDIHLDTVGTETEITMKLITEAEAESE